MKPHPLFVVVVLSLATALMAKIIREIWRSRMMFDDILEKAALGALLVAAILAIAALGFGIYFYWKWMMSE